MQTYVKAVVGYRTEHFRVCLMLLPDQSIRPYTNQSNLENTIPDQIYATESRYFSDKNHIRQEIH